LVIFSVVSKILTLRYSLGYFDTYTNVDTEMCCPKGKCVIINDRMLYPLGGGGGLWWKFEIKTQDRTLSKNNNPGLVWLFWYIYKCGHRNVLSKRQVCMSILHIINFKKKKNVHGHRSPGFFNKKLILDYYFCLMSGPVFLFQIFIITCYVSTV
jgi:hypothetical protein